VVLVVLGSGAVLVVVELGSGVPVGVVVVLDDEVVVVVIVTGGVVTVVVVLVDGQSAGTVTATSKLAFFTSTAGAPSWKAGRTELVALRRS
jgi:hypothetical protein